MTPTLGNSSGAPNFGGNLEGEAAMAEESVEIVGACKLMDGFFLGDAICAEVSFAVVIFLKDFEFLKVNKITHVVNCSADYIENFFSKKGIKYHSLRWKEF